jgi:hypothetical protein
MCNSKRSDQERQHLLRDMRTLVSKEFNAWLKMMILRFNFDITYVVIVIVDFASKEDLVLDDSLVVRRLERHIIIVGIASKSSCTQYAFLNLYLGSIHCNECIWVNCLFKVVLTENTLNFKFDLKHISVINAYFDI